MTPAERQMLTDLAAKIAQTPSPAHDAEAEEFIRTHIGNRPDALYLMTQTVLIQNMAIEHAQQEIQQLKHAAPAQGGGSFLGRGSGWASPSTPTPPPPQQPAYYPPSPAAPQSGGMGSFLRSAGTTAAGIAAGALAFEGIRSMFGGVEHLFGFGNQPRFGGGSGFFGGGHESSVADNLAPDDSVQYDDTNVSDPADDSSSSDDSSSNDDQV